MTGAGCTGCYLTHMVTTTQHFISNLIALSDITNDNLFALCHHYAIYGTSIMGCS